jgi:hypothetical protein
MIAGLCFSLWCLGPAVPASPRLTTAVETYSPNEYLEYLVIGKRDGAVGLVISDGTGVTVAGGMLPLRIRVDRFTLEAGLIMASRPLPYRGGHGNWIAQAEFLITDRLVVGLTHISNSGLSNGANPSIDALSMGWSFR